MASKAQPATAPLHSWLPQPPTALKFLHPRCYVELGISCDPDQDPEPWDKAWGPKGSNQCFATEVYAHILVDGEIQTAQQFLGGTWATSEAKAMASVLSQYGTTMFTEVIDELIEAWGEKYYGTIVLEELEGYKAKLTELEKLEEAYNSQQQDFRTWAWQHFQNDGQLYGLLDGVGSAKELWQLVKKAGITDLKVAGAAVPMPLTKELVNYVYYTANPRS